MSESNVIMTVGGMLMVQIFGILCFFLGTSM